MLEYKRCEQHGGLINPATNLCQTTDVLMRVGMERIRQFKKYGTNEDLPDGSGPDTCWLLPLSTRTASNIEKILRQDYEDFEEEVGHVTWVHLIREEIAEAFQESDPAKLVEELTQAAALLVSWIEKIEARQRTGTPAPTLKAV